MKKISLMIMLVFSSMCVQSAMADTGTVSTDIFSNEATAVKAAESISKGIEGGNYTFQAGSSINHCRKYSNLESPDFTIVPVWIENGEGHRKAYKAVVNYQFSCETKARGPYWYASVNSL
jgi:hypothetical protein